MAHRETLVEWLNDAYAMENAQVQVLENHVDDAKNHPEIHARMQDHLVKTRRHAEMVKSCVERLGDSTSILKTGMGNLMGMMQGIATGGAEDELVKNALMDYAAENFEIACYRSLILAAEEVGDHQTVNICQEILRDEEEMKSWLESQLPVVTRQFLRSEAASDRR